jgi:hypothetical protein
MWFINNITTIMVSLLIVIIVIMSIKSIKKNGHSCDGGCGHCASSSICHSHKNTLVQDYHQDHNN